jgi:hypothetical protein
MGIGSRGSRDRGGHVLTDPRELGYRPWHAADRLSRRDQLVLAKIAEAYSSLVCMDPQMRQRWVIRLREASGI